jgi:molybdate transport system ATP-binding protein
MRAPLAQSPTERLSVRIVKALPDFALDIEWSAGEGTVVLFGPSGSGKTLTLQCLAGLVRPDGGRIVVNERTVFDAASGVHVPPQARRLGYVFQGYALFPHLTVAQNIAFGLHRSPRAARAERTREVMERLGLGPLAARYPRELSGGQQQRAALGRALAPDPELILLDEPLSALDLPLRRQLRDDLASILRDWGKAAVLVTHDLAEAYQLADTVVVYEGGRVLQCAPKSELLRQPSSEAVARVIGFRNILHGTVVKAAPESLQLLWRGQLLEAPFTAPAEPDDRVTFCIRPEYVRLIRKDRPGPDAEHHMNVMSGTVVREADAGSVWTLYFRLSQPGPPAQGDYDLEIEMPSLAYELLDVRHDRDWQVALHRGSIQILPPV